MEIEKDCLSSWSNTNQHSLAHQRFGWGRQSEQVIMLTLSRELKRILRVFSPTACITGISENLFGVVP